MFKLLSLLANVAVVAFTVLLVVPFNAVKIFIFMPFSLSLISLCSEEYTVKEWEILRPVQIGTTFCIPITGVCIPCAFFLEADAKAVVKVVVSRSGSLLTLFSLKVVGGTVHY